jgi:5-formyltetrahydrofolate cyclo-ligase
LLWFESNSPNGTGGRRHLIFSPDDPIALRIALRKEMRRRRRAVAPLSRRLTNRSIVTRLLALPAYRRARALALYWPADGEPDVRALARHAWSQGKRVYLPVVGRGGAMRFARWLRGGRLRRNRYGIPEPVGTLRPVAATRLDLLVMPLVAFDERGHRLGMGGGYYDRALAGRRHLPVLVGAAFSFQEAPAIPAQPWDVPIDFVITERARRAVRRARRAASPAERGAEQ